MYQRWTCVSRFRSASKFCRISLFICVTGIAAGLPLLLVPQGVRWWQHRREHREQQHEPVTSSAFHVSRTAQVGVTVARARWNEVGLAVARVTTNTLRRQLKMDGVLYLDPDDYSQIRSRFSGEIVEVPQVAVHGASPNDQKTRPLRFGDPVRKGDLLAVVWSRDLGEKKSEFAETLARLAFDRDSLARLAQVRDSIPVNTLRDAERRVREDEIAAERIEKTLLTWQLSIEEIQLIRSELADSSTKGTTEAGTTASVTPEKSTGVDRWARVELRSPIDGTIVEKNVTVGTLVNPDDNLFKVANLTHLDVRAFAYEEDLAVLQRLPDNERKWTIRLQGDTTSKPIDGHFDRIGSLIDPVQHTGLVMGWVDNADLSLRPGQFVTASIAYPDATPLLSVPAASVVDLDSKSYVLLQDPENAEHFLPTQVTVARFQGDVACIRSETGQSGIPAITADSMVVSTGAVEIIAECREQLRSPKDRDDTGLTESLIESDRHHHLAERDGAIPLSWTASLR